MTDRTVPTEPTWLLKQGATPEQALERIAQRIAVWRDADPDEDESWESFYSAAFDMLSAEVDGIISAVAQPLAASPPAPAAEVEPVAWGEFYGGRCAAVRLDRSVHCQTPLYTHPIDAAAIRAEARRDAMDDAERIIRRHVRNTIDLRGAIEDIRALSGALADKGEAEGWRSLDDCPSDGQLVWVAGGRYSGDPEIQTADGDWWRSEAKRGSKAVPTVWMPLRVPAPPAEGSK